MEQSPRSIKLYVDSNGRCPFEEWIEGLSRNLRASVQIRIDRLESGNPGKGDLSGEVCWN